MKSAIEDAPQPTGFEGQKHFVPTIPPPEPFEESKVRVAQEQAAHLRYRQSIAEKEVERQSGGVQVFHDGKVMPLSEVPPPPPPAPGPAIGHQFVWIRDSKLANARATYYRIMRERNEDSAAELEEVAGVLGFTIDRVIKDLDTIAKATDIVRECLILESEDVSGKAEKTQSEVRAFEAETLRIIHERNQRLGELKKVAGEAWKQQHRRDQQSALFRAMADEHSELLQGLWIRELKASGLEEAIVAAITSGFVATPPVQTEVLEQRTGY